MASKLDVATTVNRHIQELRQLVANDMITADDHDAIGKVLCSNMGSLIGLSANGWIEFVRIVSESREVHYSE